MSECNVFAGLKHLSNFLNGIGRLHFSIMYAEADGHFGRPSFIDFLRERERVGDMEEIHTWCFPGQTRRQVCFAVANLYISDAVKLALAFHVSKNTQMQLSPWPKAHVPKTTWTKLNKIYVHTQNNSILRLKYLHNLHNT